MSAPWRLLFTIRDVKASGNAHVRGLPKSSVRVDFGPQHARTPSTVHDEAIEAVWRARLEKNPRLFDAPKYRLARVRCSEDPSRAQHCTLDIGLTSYREYLGTHTSEDLEAYVNGGEHAHGDGSAHLSCALGVETVLLTADEHIVLLRRSQAVATHAGLYNGPSGHPEPSDAIGGLEAGADAVLDHQIFAAVTSETVEETNNIPRESLGEPLLIGGMVDERRKPDLLFCSHTTLPAAEVVDRYRAGAPEGWESSGLVAVPPSFQAGVRSWNWESLRLELTAVTHAAMQCMQLIETRALPSA